jgi:DNA-binding response OmpR family regulator
MASRASQPTNRVLIADDDPVMRHLLTSLVQQEGCEVVVVDDGRQAYRLLQADADFKVGIFDMMMPHLEGLDIIRYMRTEKRLQRIPVMMISAERDLQLVAKSFGAGATVFFSKPFNTDQFQNTLRLLLKNQTTAENDQSE